MKKQINKTQKRKLSNEEMVVCNKMVTSRKEEKEWLEFQLDYYKLMLDKGLEQNFKKTLREYKQLKNQFEGDLFNVNNILKELEKQMREGVEVIPEEVKTENKSEELNKNKKEDK